MQTKEFLRRLTEGVGVSGHEHHLSSVVLEALGPYAHRVEVDALGNCIAVRQGEARGEGGGEAAGERVKIMLAGHVDEIGLMITKIDEHGFLRIAQVGGFDPRTLVGQEVTVHGRRALPGIIGIKPPHIMSEDERRKAAKLEELFVDIGMDAAAAGEVVSVGDIITLSRRFIELHGDVVAAKAMDDRAGVAVLLECLRRLSQMRHEADVYAVATVQEETSFGGAITGAWAIQPDIGIAIDVGHAGPGLPGPDAMELGKGPAIAMGANIHPRIHELLTRTARECGVAYQDDVEPAATGTDAWPMQISRAGVATGLISIPLRYMHTSVETGNMRDITEAGRLLAEFCARVDRAFVEGLRWS